MTKFIALVGTNFQRSTNRRLLQYMQKHFADKAEIELVEIQDIPLFNKPADKQVPEIVKEMFLPLSRDRKRLLPCGRKHPSPNSVDRKSVV